MTNLRIFDQAFKASWLERLKEQSDGWEELPRKYRIDNIILFGDTYPKKILKEIEDPFWRDVVKLCQLIQDKLYNTIMRAFNIPLWYKSGINISFRKEWFNKGYSKLSDILDLDGMLYHHEETLLRGLKIIFLEYERLRYDVLKLNLIQMNNDKNGPYLPYIYFKTGHEVRGCVRTNILKNTN